MEGDVNFGENGLPNFLDSFDTLEGYSSLLCENNANVEEIIDKIGELIAPETEQASLSNDVTFGNITSNDMEDEKINEVGEFKNNVVDELIKEQVSAEDTEFTNDTVINDKIRTEFASYESVLDIYQYIKNN